jgi:hypothetical protein
MSPTSKFPPLNAKLSYAGWGAICSLLKTEWQALKKSKRGYVEEQIWLMERQEHLQELKTRNLPHILGSLLNGANKEELAVYHLKKSMTPEEYKAQGHPQARFLNQTDDICYLLQDILTQNGKEPRDNGGEFDTESKDWVYLLYGDATVTRCILSAGLNGDRLNIFKCRFEEDGKTILEVSI